MEDEESRVFHKTLCLNQPNEPAQLLTLGATSAHLKTWEKKIINGLEGLTGNRFLAASGIAYETLKLAM